MLRLSDLEKHFPVRRGPFRRVVGHVRAVDRITLSISKKEIVGLVGESGSGKSTLGYTVVGIHNPTGGRMEFRGQDLLAMRRADPRAVSKEIQIVFQDPGSSLNPKRSIKQTLELPLRVHGLGNRTERLETLKELMRTVELPEPYLYRSPSALSGGQRQRVAVARALASKPDFLVLDEPTSALDVSVQAKLSNLLLALSAELELTYLFITHDLSLMRNVATKVAIMYLGKICELADAQTFFAEPLHPYTQMLLSSIPVVSAEEETLKPKHVVPRGEVPSPVNIPSGCSFRTRCPHAMEVCSAVDPEFVEVESDHEVRCHLFAGIEKEVRARAADA